MTKTQIQQLHKALIRLKNAPIRLESILINWIDRCDGFFKDTYIWPDDRTIEYVTDKTVSLLNSLDKKASVETILKIISEEFEGRYFYSAGRSADNVLLHWDSTSEAYFDFIRRLAGSPDNAHIDEPVSCSHKCLDWLKSVLGSSDLSMVQK